MEQGNIEEIKRMVNELPKAAGEVPTERGKIVVKISEWKGKKYVDIRNFFEVTSGGSTNWHPTKKGISVESKKLSELINLLEKAEAML